MRYPGRRLAGVLGDGTAEVGVWNGKSGRNRGLGLGLRWGSVEDGDG